MKIDWLGMTEAQLRNLLIEKFHTSEYVAETEARNFARMPTSLRADFCEFLRTGVAKCDVAIEGFTLTQLIQDRGMEPKGAFAALEWLSRDPNEAKKCLSSPIPIWQPRS